ncbi:uncharacterized protein [Arachis hypogaea]|uniref:uncharacterized protein n=1 Tax=Arachis hypogaea TaxID=3818 RepID=UPI003B227C4E
MSVSEETNSTTNPKSTISDELILQITNMLRNSLRIQSSHTNSDNLSIGFKLNGDNYPLWKTLMKKAISGRGKKAHLTGVPPAPAETEPAYDQWEQALWDGLTTTYGSGTDPMQIYNLHRRANTQEQGHDTLEEFWNKLQAIWMAIDRKQPNPMKCPEDILIFNQLKQEQRLYQFLTGIDEKFETIRTDLLKQETSPSVDSTYAAIRREAA